MIRRLVVIVLVLAGFALLIVAGVRNYHVRHDEKAAAQSPAPWAVASPQTGAAPNTADEAAQMPPSPLLGKQAPNFTLTDLQGKKVSLKSFRGKPVMVNFWATWCGPCQFEIPWLAQLHTQYAPQGFEILGVSSDQIDPSEQGNAAHVKASVEKSAHRLHINYPVLIGGDAITKAYGGVDLLPQSFYIDRNGTVVAVITGAGSKAEADADIQKAMHSGV